MRKNWLCLFMAAVILCLTSVEAKASSESISGGRVVYQLSKREVAAEHQRQLEEQISALEMEEGEYFIVRTKIQPLNDISEYKTEYSATKYQTISGYAGNQPSGGVSIPQGGSIYYSPNGGGEKSFTISFGGAYGSVGISLPLGVRTSGVSGYSANVSGPGYWKLWVDNQYSVRAYIIYKKEYYSDGAFGYTWKKFSSGSTKALYRVSLTPIKQG